MLLSRTMRKWAGIGKVFLSFSLSLSFSIFLLSVHENVRVCLRIICKSHLSADIKQLLNNAVGRAVEFMECAIV